MNKIFCLLLIFVITGIISGAGACPEVVGPSEIETISVKKITKVDLPRPFFRLEKRVLATAYTSSPGDLTFMETEPEQGTIAVDPEYIELGSIVYIPDLFPDQKFLAVDTGKKIKGWKVDIWLPSIDEAKEFGVQTLRVIIQKPLAG